MNDWRVTVVLADGRSLEYNVMGTVGTKKDMVDQANKAFPKNQGVTVDVYEPDVSDYI